jgi:hypothetical protein
MDMILGDPNDQAAQVPGILEEAGAKRYIRALD